MESNNKIYSFFILIALLFWNPLSYFLIYSNTPIYSVKPIQYVYWGVFIIGLILVILILRNLLNEIVKNIIFTVTIIGILFSSFILVDRVVGFIITNDKEQDHNQERLIFEPNIEARHKTIEFDYVVKTNNLGLRDRNININKGEKFRILCFGDSWTFGYGVNVEDSWPKKLEQYLFNKGIKNIEVINCGRPGQFTDTYRNYIEKIVPLLNPDLVLVGVLQLDDLAQLYTNHYRLNHIDMIKKYSTKIKSVFIRYFKYSFKNIIGPSKIIDFASNWKKTSVAMINEFNYWQNIRFSTLNDTVQNLFKSGNLEPSLINYYINYPDRITIFNNKNHPATKFAINKMSNDFALMKDICSKYNSDLIFINIPTNYFTGHIVIRNPSDILNKYYESNNNIDPIYRSIANKNNLPYIELTDHFIGLQNKSDYLFKYDGHPNENGYEEIANYIGKQLIKNNYLP
ncbi:MAG: hypothetical protein GWP19_04140 [Planctomycetia bacterium]|nr:hypothetical protein [Planctomycetia bacterium]